MILDKEDTDSKDISFLLMLLSLALVFSIGYNSLYYLHLKLNYVLDMLSSNELIVVRNKLIQLYNFIVYNYELVLNSVFYLSVVLIVEVSILVIIVMIYDHSHKLVLPSKIILTILMFMLLFTQILILFDSII